MTLILSKPSPKLKYTFETGTNAFFKDLKGKVDQYFTDKKLHPAGNGKLYFKSALQVLSATGIYVLLVFFTPITPVSILLCLILGINLAVIGFNVMHEGGHQTFSKHTWINNASAYFLNVLGGNTYSAVYCSPKYPRGITIYVARKTHTKPQ